MSEKTKELATIDYYNSVECLQLWEERFVEFFSGYETDDHSHDLAHFQRVWKTAQEIILSETRPVNKLVVMAACYFHDVITFPKNHPDRSRSSQVAAERTDVILMQMAFPAELLAAVHHAIAAHSFSANIPTMTAEAEIVQDSDRMEAIGAIGLARVFYTGGKMGSQLFDGNDPWAERRELDDRKYSIDHFFCKLLTLGDSMKTEAGRKIATRHTDYLKGFLEKLREELA